MGFPGGSVIKNTPASDCRTQETWVQSMGWEDPVEKEMATHLQYSYLENSMDRVSWWATVHGVTKQWTRLSLPACNVSNIKEFWTNDFNEV